MGSQIFFSMYITNTCADLSQCQAYQALFNVSDYSSIRIILLTVLLNRMTAPFLTLFHNLCRLCFGLTVCHLAIIHWMNNKLG